MEKVLWQTNKHKAQRNVSALDAKQMKTAFHFHKTLPGYAPTPLYSLKSLAKYLGLGAILVKDESFRFDLNSFKVLGSSYAIANYLNGENELKSFSEIKQAIQPMPQQTFATATDGNHGLGLAWTAKQFDQNAVVYMPKNSAKYRLDKIKGFRAKAEITDFNYDDTVRYASQLSQTNGWILMQDTAWEGYVEIPNQIMQGYLTILAESIAQFDSENENSPTHVFLQAGVGSFAAAILDGLKHFVTPNIKSIIVEPTQADCIYQSACSLNGTLEHAKGNLCTIMAGLSCGELNPMAWNILKAAADYFSACPDYIASKGMRVLGNPLNNDPRIISGESGAVTLGLLFEICKNPMLADFKKALKLDSNSRILLINTEGDTDPENYRKICWDGIYSETKP